MLPFRERVLRRKTFLGLMMGVRFRVVFDAKICNEADIDGITDRSNGVIVIDPTISDSALFETALHEVLELLNYRLQWNLAHWKITQISVWARSLIDNDDGEPKEYQTVKDKRKHGGE